jgi:hypothetical protein
MISLGYLLSFTIVGCLVVELLKSKKCQFIWNAEVSGSIGCPTRLVITLSILPNNIIVAIGIIRLFLSIL